MDIPALRLLLLDQGECFLEDHMSDFLDASSVCFTRLASTSCQRHAYLWKVLKGHSPVNVEWVLRICESNFRVCEGE